MEDKAGKEMNSVINQLGTFLEENKTAETREFVEKLFHKAIEATKKIKEWERRTGLKYSSRHVRDI